MDVSKKDYPHARKIGQKIRLLREQKRITTSELGQRSGFSQQQISAVELGIHNTTIETIARLAQALGASLGQILNDEAFEQLQAHSARDWHSLAIDLAQACLEAPKLRVPLALSLFASELQQGLIKPGDLDSSQVEFLTAAMEDEALAVA